jgi:hypothetical protein
MVPVSSTKQPIGTQSRKNKNLQDIIRLVAIYGAESWTLNKDIAKRLATFQRNVLGIMSGGLKINENWRMWYNKFGC